MLYLHNTKFYFRNALVLKKVNLLNIANIINLELVNDNPEVKKYTGLEGTKDNEQKDLCLLYDMILSLEKDYHCVENFYLNYKIPQINKEFDLLRIGKTSIVNIELKSKNIDEETPTGPKKLNSKR